jgi:hypothetical protein
MVYYSFPNFLCYIGAMVVVLHTRDIETAAFIFVDGRIVPGATTYSPMTHIVCSVERIGTWHIASAFLKIYLAFRVTTMIYF